MHSADSEKILNSWKEIALYLRRGTRTVQRWERDLGLPVHRLHGKSRSPVVALCQELDFWVSSRPQSSPAMGAQTRENIMLSRGLRSKSLELHREISLKLLSLVSKLEQIQKSQGHDCVEVADALGQSSDHTGTFTAS
jgi:hypothetical protein